LLSHLGLQMLSVAVSWDLYLQTKSPIVLGNVGLVQIAPALLLGLHAGHIADRYDRRRIVIVAQALVLIASGLLAVTSPSVILIYSALFLAAVARAFQWSARAAILPSLVPSAALHNALAWYSGATELASVSGPALAGLLLASVGSKTAYVLQFGCAVAGMACYSLIRPTVQAEGKDPTLAAVPMTRALREGLGFVWNDPLILPAISLDLFAVLFGGATVLLPIYAAEILHAGARGLGWLRAAPSIGAISVASPLDVNLAVRFIHQSGHVGTRDGMDCNTFSAGNVSHNGFTAYLVATPGAIDKQVAMAFDDNGVAFASDPNVERAFARLGVN
jgi:MFS family permease